MARKLVSMHTIYSRSFRVRETSRSSDWFPSFFNYRTHYDSDSTNADYIIFETEYDFNYNLMIIYPYFISNMVLKQRIAKVDLSSFSKIVRQDYINVFYIDHFLKITISDNISTRYQILFSFFSFFF